VVRAPVPVHGKLSQIKHRFFMKQVPAVHQTNLKSQIPAPLSVRWPLAMWD
jgi:hypothetical protein